ncbi:MAG: phosphatidate cytidylyltransferase [Clostridia bacterium]|nr:phosphatidate cytidylyltransferase [Clostridia bacterium]
MKVRILSATVGILLLAGVVVLSMYYPFAWNIAIAILTGTAVHEAVTGTHCCRSKLIRQISVVYGASLSLLVLLRHGSLLIIAAATMLYIMAVFVIGMKQNDNVNFKQVSSVLSLTILIACTFLCITFVRQFEGLKMALLMVAIAWLTDTFALFSGMLFGKHKLSPVISPKKTVEGAVGGFIMCIALCMLGCWLYAEKVRGGEICIDLLNLGIVTAVCSVVSMIGDLSFSFVKRYYKIKDYGKIMPGHGGVLDRFDSVLFVAPVFLILCQYLPFVGEVVKCN